MPTSSLFIEQTVYDAIVEQMPICCVDVIPVYKDSFLLSLRTNDPGKGTWFPIGGRVYKGEELINTAIRKSAEELGVTLSREDLRKVTVSESIFTGIGIDQNRHSVNVIFTTTLTEAPSAFSLDNDQLEQVEWFTAIDPTWHPYVQEALRALGFT